MRLPRVAAALFSSLALGVAACLTFGSDSSGNNNTNQSFDPVKMQSYLSRNFSHIPYILDALNRVLGAANGLNPPGVTYTRTSTGITGTVTVDLKGNGSDIGTVNATLTYTNPAVGISGGGTLAMTSINTGSTTGTANAAVAVNGNFTSVTFSNGSADLHPTSAPELLITNANLTATPTFTNTSILGSAGFATDNKTGTVFFESNGSGGWRIRVTSPNFATFTIP